MSTTNRNQLLQDAFTESERLGNLTILFTNALANHVGLSATEFECLSLLRDGALSAGTLSKQCGLTSGAVTGLIDRLEREGYVERHPDPGDRRRVLVQMKHAQALRERATALYEPLGKAVDELMARYTDEELTIIVDYIHRINAILEHLTLEMPNAKV